MTFLLKLKHWQLFLLSTVLPFALYIGTFVSVIFVYQNPLLVFKVFPVIIFAFMFGHYGWMFASVRKLHPLLPDGVKLKINSFYFFFFFPVLYIVAVSCLAAWLVSTVMGDPGNFDPLTILPFMLLFMPVHFFSMFCIMYCYYFVAKTIKSVEAGREAVSNDYIGDFFLVWFFPVGLWFLQPRINKLVSGTEAKSPFEDLTNGTEKL